jgi:hypothetical protein
MKTRVLVLLLALSAFPLAAQQNLQSPTPNPQTPIPNTQSPV